MDIKINVEGKYLRTAKVKKVKIDLGKALIKRLTKKGNYIWNRALLELQYSR